MNVKEGDLDRFRRTILKHQWKESYQIASTLFAKNVPQCTIFVTNQMKRSYLRFQSRLNLAWVVSFAHDVTHSIQERYEGPDLPKEAGGTFVDAPYGVSSLVSGIVELWRSVSIAHEANEKAVHLAVALNEFIIAELANYWEAVHHDELQLREMFWDAPTTEGRIILPVDIDREKLYRGISFLKQPESIGYHSARLLSIADEIELILDE